uniref:Uncharacterized protein LOC108045876 n=1 Tax=Drosophila rhopaloa TaxID=1041015 RepID=A0A6P4F0D7_DRORH
MYMQGVYTDVTSYVDWIKTTVKAFATLESPKPKIWLYNDCSGNTLQSKLRAQIYAPNFMGQGVFITDRFIITNARGLPVDVHSLDVGLAGTSRNHNEFRVDAIFRYRESYDFKNDVALLKLRQSVKIDGFKPICMLARKYSQPSLFTTFDYVQTEEHVHIYRYTVELFNNQI